MTNKTMRKIEEITHTLEHGSTHEKIEILEKLTNSTEPEIIFKIISALDDSDIQVRGEAFSTLVLNKNKISDMLIQRLDEGTRYIKAFSALILANRNDTEAIPSVIKLVNDKSSLVRSCALGALGYLKASEAIPVIHSCFTDTDLEVKKSAIKAALDLNEKIEYKEMKNFEQETDAELEKLLTQIKEKK